MVIVSREIPRQDDVLALIRQSDALMQSLYPAESNHLVDVETLARPEAHVFVAREDGRALGCGAFMLGEVGQPETHALYRRFGYVERGPFGA